MLFRKTALCAAAILCSTQAHAANRLFIVHTTGTGIQIGAPGADDPYKTNTLTDLLFTFSLYDQERLFTTPGVSQAYLLGGTSFGTSTSGFSAGLRIDYTEAGFSACFANPSALLPTAPVEIATTCGGSASFRSQGFPYGYVNYTGTVTKLQVLPEDGPARSGFVGFSSAVPEPGTWALMLAGFAMTGYALRRRRAAVAVA